MAIPIINLSYLNGINGFRITGEPFGYNLGASVSGIGDMNGDGFDDVMVGSQYDYPPDIYIGRSYIVFGKASGFDATLDIRTLDGSNGFRLGNEGSGPPYNSPFGVSDAGDINGDGFDDVIIGARGFYSSYTRFKGAGYVVFGKSAGFPPDFDLTVLDGANGFRLDVESSEDVAVNEAGDVNGDGFDDVIIGAPEDDAAYVVLGKASGFDATLDLTRLDGNDGFRLEGTGATVSSAGDLNGDGFDDVSVGIEDQNAGYVVYGKATGFDPVISLATLDGIDGFRFSDGRTKPPSATILGEISVDDAGDINGDGIDDLIIGMQDFYNFGNQTRYEGDNYVLFGRSADFSESVDLSSLDGRGGFRLKGGGSVVSGAGDVNGDGFDDLLIGGIYVMFGKSSGFEATFDLFSLDGDNGFKVEGGGFGISGAGDVNNDGFDDVMIGDDSRGVSYVMFGGPFLSGVPVYRGTSGDDRLIGTMTAEVFEAGDGNDTIEGGGGADILEGGAGDDTFTIVDSEFVRINGGSGKDTLKLADGLDLDLADFEDIIEGIEAIDLRGEGDNTLTLTLSALLGLSDTTTTFTIDGAGTDRVLGLNSGWVDRGLEGDYRVFTNSWATLRVASAVPTDAPKLGVINLADLNGSDGFRMDGVGLDDELGRAVSDAGDVNGDGFDDVIVGAYMADPRGRSSGSSYIVFGKASGFDAAVNLSSLDGHNGFRLDGVNKFDDAGFSVSSAGDFNSDGFDDLIVGAPGADPNYSGSSYIVFGKASGFWPAMGLSNLNGNNGFRIAGVAALDQFGRSVSNAGDVNGDGFDDVIISGSYVVFGKSSESEATFDLSSLDGSNGFRLDGTGSSVSTAGDINGDGFGDVIVDGMHVDPNGSSSGSSYVIFGKATGFEATLDLFSLDGSNGFRIDGESEDDYPGRVSSAGDVNGDGIDDVIIGVPRTDPNGNYSGSSYVVFGKASGFAATLNLSDLNGGNGFRIDGVSEDDFSGTSVSGVGDVNGDGFDDVIVGVVYGPSYVVFGKASGFSAKLDLSTLDNNNGFRIDGTVMRHNSPAVSGAGDVNGDSFDDLIVGDPYVGYRGASYVIFGRKDFGSDSVIEGTPADDQLRGTSAAELFRADDGNDLMIGRGGADEFYGGSGVDQIKVADLNFALVDGGSGNDVLHMAGKDLNLDLTDYVDKIQGIETICVYGRGDNTLALTGAELKGLSDTTNTLKVHGNAGDRVILEGNWVDEGSHGYYHTYTQDDAVLLVGMNMTAVVA